MHMQSSSGSNSCIHIENSKRHRTFHAYRGQSKHWGPIGNSCIGKGKNLIQTSCFRKCSGVFYPSAWQRANGKVTLFFAPWHPVGATCKEWQLEWRSVGRPMHGEDSHDGR